jgi:hypothetical protein
MTSRKFSSDCGVMEGPPFATSVCQTLAATQRSMIACEPARRSMTWKSGILEPGGWQSPNSIRRKIRAIHRYNAGCRPRPGRPRQDSQPLPRGRRVRRRHVVRETRAPPDDRSPRGTGAILQWRMVDLRCAGDGTSDTEVTTRTNCAPWWSASNRGFIRRWVSPMSGGSRRPRGDGRLSDIPAGHTTH